MGLVTSTNRHTALDPDVVLHEYVHGLTNRLVGGPLNDAALEAAQSRGMGEGWSDYFACTALGKNVVGDWVVNRVHRHQEVPLRREPSPTTYADLGTGRYDGRDEHALGELWCAVLMSLAARRVGAWPFTQIVVDALEAHLGEPELPRRAGRDPGRRRPYAHAHGVADPAGFVHTVWQVFARYGMGPGARTDGANVLTGIVADFEAPPAPASGAANVHAEAQPRLAIPDNDPSGVVSVLTVPDAGILTSVAVDRGHHAPLHRRPRGRAGLPRRTPA